VVKPGPQCLAGELAEPLGVPGDGYAPVGQVEVVQGEIADRGPAGGLDRGQGDDEALRGAGGCLFNGPDLSVGHRQQAAAGVASFQAQGRVGEDQSAFLREPEQRPDRGGGGAELVAAQRV
jgi:hypothetical protein